VRRPPISIFRAPNVVMKSAACHAGQILAPWRCRKQRPLADREGEQHGIIVGLGDDVCIAATVPGPR